MSFTITDAFVQQFTGAIHLVAQQETSRLEGCVRVDMMTGEAAYFEQLGATAARKVMARHGDSPMMNSQHLRRRLVPYDYDWGDMIDKLDKLKMIADPTSPYTMAAAAALNRGKDDEIIGAFFGTAYAGHTGGTAVVWPNGNAESNPPQPGGTVVAVNSWAYGTGSGNAGLTISKLIEANVALDAAEGDENEPRYIVVKAKHKGQLLATTEVTNVNYNSVKALVDGKINSFMGFEFKHSERLGVDSNGFDRIPAWRKGGMGLGIVKDISGRVAERPDKRFSWYVYADMSIGASRLEEAKITEIKTI
jgi:hypothetical protein